MKNPQQLNSYLMPVLILHNVVVENFFLPKIKNPVGTAKHRKKRELQFMFNIILEWMM
jgi:hypothetical protein